MDLEQKKYPIGRFQKPVEFDEGKIKDWITVIKEFPNKVKELTQNMSDEQLILHIEKMAGQYDK